MKPQMSHAERAQKKLAALVDDARLRLDAERQARRELILDPNRGQVLKLARYSCTLSRTFTLGKPCALSMKNSPASTIRVKRVVTNVLHANFVMMCLFVTANVAVTLGDVEDAVTYAPFSNVRVDWATMSPMNEFAFSGYYTGLCPAPYMLNNDFTFTISLFGPAHLAGARNLVDLKEFPKPVKLPFPDKRATRKRKAA
jgi:hypothetical protein